MIKKMCFCLMLLVSVIINIGLIEAVNQIKGDKKLVAYYPSWAIYGRKYPVSSIPAEKITYINYAFAKNDAEGNVSIIDPWADTDHRSDWNTQRPYWGNFKELQDLKQKYPHLKTFISIGGWTLSDKFSAMAAEQKTRQNFAKNAVAFARKYGFDGIDIDWKYPGFAEHKGKPEDTKNYTELLKELRAAINKNAEDTKRNALLLTIAAPAGVGNLKNIELDKIHGYLDWINVMSYDFNGPWDSQNRITNHNAPLYSPQRGDPLLAVQPAVQYFIDKGVPRKKIVVGLPLYGRTFGGVMLAGTDKTGLFSRFSEMGSGSEKGMRLFNDIKTNLLNSTSGYTRYWDNTSQVPYLYNPTKKEFVSYDDEESLKKKAEFIRDNNLGGVMVWELDTGVEPALDSILAGL